VARISAALLAGALALAAMPASAQITYTWNKTTSNSWAVSTNWNPTRTTPATNDILVFDGGLTPTAVVTNLPTTAQTIGRLRFIGNVKASFTAESRTIRCCSVLRLINLLSGLRATARPLADAWAVKLSCLPEGLADERF